MEEAEAAHLPFEGYGRELVRELRTGVHSELAASPGVERFELSGGRFVGFVGNDPCWSFDAPIDPSSTPAAETPARVTTSAGDELAATVIAVGDESVTMTLSAGEPSQDLSEAKLELDTGFVLTRLLGRLDELETDGADLLLVDELLSPEQCGDTDAGGAGEDLSALSADAEQDRAANLAVEPGVRFTWGPPGTGKTRVLAKAVGIAARREDHVLVLAHANAAVDVAAARIVAELAGDDLLTTGSVLRVGTPLPGAVGLDDVLPERIAGARDPELVGERDRLRAERSSLSDQLRRCNASERDELNGRLADVRRGLASLDRTQRQAERDLVDAAPVVITTLARAIVDDAIWSREWDVVVIDEASMAPLPMVLALTMRAPTTLSALGDPRQLPPVHTSDEELARHWFARDLFSYAGFDEPGHDPWTDPRLSALRIQFRMGETICAAVDEFAYDGLLRTDRLPRNRAIRLAESRPAQSAELVVIDTSRLGCHQWSDPTPESYSRLNPTAGLLDVTIASRLTDTGCESVAMVSPYRAQVRWLRALAGPLDGVVASTVHRMQGAEADAVVFDVTDTRPSPGPSRLTGGDGDLASRLLTVAASRARGKLIVVVGLDFVQQQMPLGSAVRRFLDALDNAGATHLDALDVIDEQPGPDCPVRWFPNWKTATAALATANRTSGVSAPQPWVATDDCIALGAATADGAAAVISGSHLVHAFVGGVAGNGGN